MHELIILMAVPLFFTLIACEAMLATRRRVGASVRANDGMTSVGLGAMSQVTGVFWRLAMVWTYVVTYEHLRLFEMPQRWWVWPLALVLYDLCYYWHHRLMHEVAVFWAAHSVHHSSEAFNLTTALRKPSTGFLVAWVFYLPLALIGISPAVFAVVGLINLLYQYWIHTEQIGSLGWLDRVLCTPSNHRVHHATNERYLDKNYGGILILWDRLFGSFVEESHDDPCVYGVKTPVRTFDPVRVNLWPYAEVWQRLRRARSVRERWRAVFGSPSLDVDGRSPVGRPAGAGGPAHLYDPVVSRGVLAYAGVQFVSSLLLASYFLVVGAGLPLVQRVAFCLLVVATLWSVGRLLDDRSGIIPAEAARLLAQPLLVPWVAAPHVSAGLATPLQAALAAFSLVSLMGLAKVHSFNAPLRNLPVEGSEQP